MVIHTMQSKLSNTTAEKIYTFMINPPPETYAKWLPDEHYKFHHVKHSKKTPINDLLYYDQNIGKKYRMKFYAKIRLADKPKQICFQMRKFGINLPGFLELQFCDTADGIILTETIRVGFNGCGKIIDLFIKLYFNKSFFKEMNEHHKREWMNLAEIL